jgi:hypothetical protein
MFNRMAMWTAALVLGLVTGCGDGGGGSGGTAAPAPSAAEKTTAQSAAPAGGAVEQTAEFSTDAVVESGAPGATSSKTGQAGSAAPSTPINYQASVTLTVDLDAPGGSGTDAHPNASGVFQVTATGTVTGDAMNGQATYAVDVQWLTNGTFTDPCCGAQATVNAGSHVNYVLTVQWAKIDEMNWSIQATYDVSGAGSGTVTHRGRTWDVTGTVVVHANATFSRAGGTYSFTFGISGLRSIVLTSGAEVHTVTVTTEALDRIFIDVDGVTFGPYTLAQIIWWFGFDCRG